MSWGRDLSGCAGIEDDDEVEVQRRVASEKLSRERRGFPPISR